MEKYIGVKLINAEPMTRVGYDKFRRWELPEDEDGSVEGYLVEYLDGGNPNTEEYQGYVSWSPKEVFDSAYIKIPGEGTKIDASMVNNFLGEITTEQIDAKTTHVKAETITGFVKHEFSSCVDPKNYDQEIGKHIAIDKIKDTLWLCLGFVLQWGMFGLNKKDKIK